MATYTAIVHEAEEGGYWAEVLELPGCGSQGETLDELEKNLIEAIHACLSVYFEDKALRLHRWRKWDIPVDDGQVVGV